MPSVSPTPRSGDPIQADATQTAAKSSSADAGNFAKALSDAGGKPLRKHATLRQQDDRSGGTCLPAAGNPPPLAPAPPPTAAQLPAAPRPPDTSAAATVPPAAGVSPVAAPPAGAANAGSAPGTAAISVSSNRMAALSTTPEQGAATIADMAAALAAAGAALDAATPVATPEVSDAGAGTQPKTPATAPPPAEVIPTNASGSAVALRAAAAEAKPSDIRVSKIQIVETTSGKTAADSRLAENGPALNAATVATDGDAAAQAVIAAASAGRTSTASHEASASADDLAMPDTGVMLQGGAAAAGPDAPTMPAVVAAAAHTAQPSTAADGAAGGASFAQAMLASADAGLMDKRHDNFDSSTCGVPNDGSAGAAQLLASNTSMTDAASGASFKVAAALNTPEFGQGLADRVALMMDGNLTSAKLQVNPPALGPIEVRIALQSGHAQVWLSSHSAVTRDALESSAPKLREMLGSQGFAQVSVDISQRSFQERTPQPQVYETQPAIGELSGIRQTSASLAHRPSGLLDAYA